MLGRGLDALYDYGVTKLFSEIAFEIGIEQKLLGRSAHGDTSSLSVYGAYAMEESTGVGESARPCHGYSKDHRPDLKQMVIHLATTGASGFPVWMEAHSGNASDKKVLHEAAERMQAFCAGLKAAPHFMYVGDSALYENSVKKAQGMLWLSRVPERIKAAQVLLECADEALRWQELDDGYRISALESTYGGVRQRWLVVFSAQAYAREMKTLERAVTKEYNEQTKALGHLSHQLFRCQADAQKAAAQISKGWKYHRLKFEIVPHYQHTGRGRPKAGVEPQQIGFYIQGQLIPAEDTLCRLRAQKGRFILATNQLDQEILTDEDMLLEYKAQSKTEGGFKFIKDDTFEVDSIFLKKPERIQALMMVMTLCLMVYSVAQYQLRQALEAADETLPSQSGKPTPKPTMKWIYRLFHGVQVVTLSFGEMTQTLVINVNALLQRIVGYFGETAQQIYGIKPSCEQA